MKKIILTLLILSHICTAQIPGVIATSKYYGGQDIQNPIAIFGSSNTKLLINTQSTTNKTLTGNWSERITSLVSDDANAYALQTNTTGNEVLYNTSGKGIYFPGAGYLTNSSTSNFNMLHDGTDFIIAFSFMPVIAAATAGGNGVSSLPIICNNGGTTAQTGIVVLYVNTGGVNAINVIITKSSAGNSVYNLNINSFWTVGSYTSVIIEKVGTTLTVYKNGISAGSSSRLNIPVVTDASGNFFIGKFSNAATYLVSSMLKNITIVSGTATALQRNSLNTWVNSGNETIGNNSANWYLMLGQSNMRGQGATGNPSAPLQTSMNAYTFTNANNGGVVTPDQKFDKVLWGTNPGDILFGPDLKLAYSMAATNPNNTFITKYAVGGTALVDGITTPDWNITGIAATENVPRTKLAIRYSLLYMKCALDRNVTVRGIGWRQGETDALNGTDVSTTYKTDFYATMKVFIDEIYTCGFTTDKMRLVVSLISNAAYNPVRPWMTQTDAVLQLDVDNFKTDNPTYSSKYKGGSYFITSDLTLGPDTTHFPSSQQEVHGDRFYNAWSPYINE